MIDIKHRLLAPHLNHHWIISETISAVANDGDSWPTFIITNTLLSAWLLFIGTTRCIQIHYQLMHVNSTLICMRRFNVITLLIGGGAILSMELLAIIRIKISFDWHILFAQICFWCVIFYQFCHVILCYTLSRHCQLSQEMQDSQQRKYFEHTNIINIEQIQCPYDNNKRKSKYYLPSGKTLMLLSWFICCNIISTGSLIAFTIEQSGFQFEETQFGKESNILEWIGVFMGFVYFLGYSVLFYSHPIGSINRKGTQMPVISLNDFIL